MLSVVLALGSSLAWGVSDYLAGVESRRRPLLAVLFASQAAAVVAALVLYWSLSREGLTGTVASYGVICGSLLVVAVSCFYAALGRGPIGVVAPIMACSAGVPVGVGAFLGDSISIVQWFGIIACLVGGVLTVAEPGGRIEVAPIILALCGMTAFGAFLVMFNRGTENSFAPVLLMTRSTVLVAVCVAICTLRVRIGIPPPEIPAVAAVGLLDVLSMVLFAIAGRSGELGVISVVASLYPVVTVLMAWVLLKERLSPLRRIGGGVVLTGVAVLAVG